MWKVQTKSFSRYYHYVLASSSLLFVAYANWLWNRCSWDSKSLRAVGISNESCRIKGNAVSWRNVCSRVKLCELGKCARECEWVVGNSYQWINFKFQSIFVCLCPLHSLIYSQFLVPASLTYSIMTFLGFLAALSDRWSKIEIEKYRMRGSNSRPLACEASVIATTPTRLLYRFSDYPICWPCPIQMIVKTPDPCRFLHIPLF